MTKFKLKIASRRSKLAMVQTLWVKEQLEKNIPSLEVSIEAMATQGDKILDVALAKIGDKGLFTKELEAQMLIGHADIKIIGFSKLVFSITSKRSSVIQSLKLITTEQVRDFGKTLNGFPASIC